MQTADPSKSEISINGQRRYVCCICGRISLHKTKSHGNIYCAKHYKQIKKYGHPTDSNPRTIYDRNEIRIDGDVAYVDLYDNKCNVIAAAIIDAEDVPLIRYTKWKLSNSGYAMNTPKFSASNTHMSRVILGVDCIADHIMPILNVISVCLIWVYIHTKKKLNMPDGMRSVYCLETMRIHAKCQLFQKKEPQASNNMLTGRCNDYNYRRSQCQNEWQGT